MSGWDSATTLIAILAGSSVLAAIASNRQKIHQHRKEVIAAASKSALKRVEMYYRLRRRNKDGSEDSKLRDLFHDIQEENDYYMGVLEMEAPWLGESYEKLLSSIEQLIQPFITKAWVDGADGADAQLSGEIQPETKRLMKVFTRDSRRLFNPLMRPLIRIKYTINNFFRKDGYGIK